VNPVTVRIDDASVEVEPGTSVAAMLANLGIVSRRSVSGESRAAVCGMGICHECRVTIDGRPNQRGCMTTVVAGMIITTDV
jgi:predicted molibdopterin-dependent oxidoreductase YjgC